MNQKNLDILTNIIGAVETGGQIYGKRRYDCYVPPYHNSDAEHTCTLGWAGNYGNNARKLVQMIFNEDKTAFRKADTAHIEKKLKVDWVVTKWNPTKAEKNALIAIITTTAGKRCQDELFQEDMKKYIKKAEEFGVTDVKAQMMWCEIEHLGGLGPVKRIFNRAKKPYTPDSIFQSLLKDQNDTSNNNQVGDKKFQSRHECCVKWIKQYVDEDKEEESMTLIIGSARMGENGHITGGAAGDQTGGEVSMQNFYMHSKGWYCLRPKTIKMANKMADAMRQACDNNNIGYDQNSRNGVITQLKKYGTLASIKTKTESDCSSLVRACIIQSSGKDVGDIYTGNLASALESSGLFAKRFSVSSESQLYNGDVLVTKAKGHTVIVVSGRKRKETGTDDTPIEKPADTNNVSKGQKWLNSNYSSAIKKATGKLLEIDGSYGTHSRWAALAVWKDLTNRRYGYNLTPSNKNFLDSCKKAAKKALTKKGDSGTYTYIIQFVLSAKGFYTGKMDAEFGSETESAVKAFQKSRGLSEDGDVGANTWFSIFN